MAASGVADIAVGFEWTPFSHGFVFWEYPGPEHLPPADNPHDAREWTDPNISEGAHAALRRTLKGKCDVDALLSLLDRMLGEWWEAGEFRRMRL